MLKYAKGVKLVSKGLFAAIVVSGAQAVNAWSHSDGNWRTNDGNKWGVTGKAALDVAINLPNNQGFVGLGPEGDIQEGMIIDRFGYTLRSSRFFSPKGTPYTSRNLLEGTNTKIYQGWRVTKSFQVRGGPIADSDGLPTGGFQFRSELPVGKLVDGGFIEPLPPEPIVELPEFFIIP